MKKLLYILLVAMALFTACDGSDPVPPTPKIEWKGDWNDSKDPNYKPNGYNPIAGKWVLKQKTGKDVTDFLVYYFKDGRSLEKATVKPAAETEPAYTHVGSYQINDKQYRLSTVIYPYQLAGTGNTAMLTITEGKDVLTFTPYESGAWYWKGDWNDPSHPMYATYKGKYNPIKGMWKMTHEGNYETISFKVWRFSENFIHDVSTTPNLSLFIDPTGYIINDNGLMTKAYKTTNLEIPNIYFKYRIEGNTLTLEFKAPYINPTLKFVRY